MAGVDGNFYGTTYSGGASNAGTIFKVTPGGTLTSLHSFSVTDGEYPAAGLALDGSGNFYGTTSGGGANGDGTVFTLSSGGAFTTIHSFTGADGSSPASALTFGSDGNFYGTTESGGANAYFGTVFKITPSGSVTTLYSFAFTDGSGPYASLTAANGIFYGAASNGGANTRYGTLFSITPGGALTTLANFAGSDASTPESAMTLANDGDFYGTSVAGGANGQFGTIYKMTPAGVVTIIYSFAGSDGANPTASLTLGTDGNLYGTTSQGGANGYGGVFRVVTCPLCTTTTVTSTANPDTFGGSVTLTATVTASSGSGTPTGSVTFQDGGSSLGAAIPLTNGSASLTLTNLTAGSHSISGTYTGTLQSSTGTLVQVVSQEPTSTLLSSSINPSAYEQSVNFTAVITPATATGSITFSDGQTILGTAPLVGGSASFSTKALNAATHSIAVSYAGNANVQGSNGTLSQVVTPCVTSLALTSTLSPASLGQAVTFVAALSFPTGDAPSGTVTFSQNGVPVGSPVPVIGGQATNSITFPNSGPFNVTAVYSGDANNQTSGGAFAQVINPAATSVTLASNLNPAVVGQQVTFVATVAAPAGDSPSGTVTFSLAGTPVGQPVSVLTSQASVAITFPNSGPLTISAVYSGDANNQTSNASILETVNSYVAPQLTTLYSFAGPDGSDPSSGMVLGSDGDFYGTTPTGGANSAGSVFKISPAGVLTTVYSFSGPDGSAPYSSLTIGTDGNFYGTTSSGGTYGNGTVFQITPAGTLNTLYSFAGPDGSSPLAGLIQGANAQFYGTTSSGGANGAYGTVFSITSTGTLTQLYSFQGSDGTNPSATLTLGISGNFYGSTVAGGSNGDGTIFNITPAGVLTTLYQFAGADGASPYGALTLNTDGRFYGTTSTGGTNATELFSRSLRAAC